MAGLVRYEFDLAAEIPLRARLFVAGAEEYVLVLTMHHIAGDGWSYAPLARDLDVAYSARCTGIAPGWAPLPVQYGDYTLWQREYLGDIDDPGSELAGQMAFWERSLTGLPERLELPTDRPYPSVASYRGAAVPVAWPVHLHEQIRQVAGEFNVTTFMVVHAALAVLLSRMSGSADIAVGVPVAGRGDAALNDLVGFFVNTLVLRTDVSGDPGFGELVEQVRERSLDAFANQDVPFEVVVERLNPARSQAHHPLVQVMFAWQNNENAALDLGGVDVSVESAQTGTARVDLSFSLGEILTEDGDVAGIHGAIVYRTDLFDALTVEHLAGRLRRVLDAVVADPRRRVSSIEVFDEDERVRLTAFSNRQALTEDVAAESIPALFAVQARRTPDAVAVVCEQRSWTYRELDENATRFAHLLIDRGVRAGDVVALLVPRSGAAIVSMLAVLAAGAAYLPIDVRHPDDRIGFMLGDASPVAVITTDEYACRLAGHDVAVIDVADRTPIDQPDTPLTVTPASELAYIIYTSGTTGTPKGVALTHTGIGDLIADQAERFGVDADSRVLQFASWSFDAAVSEIWVTLVTGATLVIPPDDAISRISGTADLIRDSGITHVTLTPSVLGALSPEGSESVRSLVVAGEATSAELVDRWAPGRSMVNAYGPTEATVCATVSEPLVAGSGVLPIGRPISGTAVFVLDSGLSEVPVGVIGELYIA
ncbi:AMP-binding protein, partial [Nocardia sp. NPDC052001]|uniref:non-ribosomal peptide synthetase n=1 Tax=Nocardia sp. NPDC052001 TaxID=3154853 RepID=UPI00342E6C4D